MPNKKPSNEAPFRPSKSETKADNTTKIAAGIIEADASARLDKTQRLRKARLEREESAKALPVIPPRQKAGKKASVKTQSAD